MQNLNIYFVFKYICVSCTFLLRVKVEISCHLSDGKIDRITRFSTYVCLAERQLGKVLPFKNLGVELHNKQSNNPICQKKKKKVA